MSLNIQTATGLLEIGGSVTKEKVISALGYEPADKTHVEDTDVHVSSEDRTTWNNKSDFSGAYADLLDAPNITENDSGNMVIADESGNIIMQVDEDGLETTKVITKTIELDGKDLGVRLDELEASSLPNILDNESGDLTIADESGNVIMKVDASGLETTQVIADTVVAGGINVGSTLSSHTGNNDVHITATERTVWNAKADKTYVDEAVANLVNSAPEALNTLDELAAALGDDANFATTVTNQIASKVDQTEFDTHTHTKADVGLGNVDNTSDANKPVSTAQQAALDNLKSELSESIVSEAEEWTIIDNSGNIIARVDAGGLETTTVTVDAVVLNGTDLQTALNGKANSSHTHDQYLESADISGLATTEYVNEQLNTKADSDHTHSQYLTANDISNKADKSELHSHSNKTEIDKIVEGKVAYWDAKSDFSGAYADLEGAPNITEDNSGDLVIADNDGNIIFRSNGAGFETTTLTAQTVIVNGTNVETELVNKVNSSALSNYYTKAEIDSLELITIADIDAICSITA